MRNHIFYNPTSARNIAKALQASFNFATSKHILEANTIRHKALADFKETVDK